MNPPRLSGFVSVAFCSCTFFLLCVLHQRAAEAASIPSFPEPAPQDEWSILLDQDRQAVLVQGRAAHAAAWGSYSDVIHKTGWGLLDLHSSPAESGEAQSYAVGFLEGALTHKRITDSLTNTWGIDFAGYAVDSIPKNVRNFVTANNQWMRAKVAANPNDDYWRTLGYLLDQVRGISDGYNYAREKEGLSRLEVDDVYMLSLINADMDDLTAALSSGGGQAQDPAHLVNESEVVLLAADVSDFDKYDLRTDRRKGHCSVLVQPTKDQLFVSHVTFDVYRNMLRMVKYLDMPLPGAQARRMSFTSFPGNLYSADGFHVVDTGLTVVETTISNYNKHLWKAVTPHSVMTWARAMVANRLATTGDAWTELQVRHNSGTCNNQWIIVDYNRFSPGEPLKDGLVWISETMPGHARRADVTPIVSEQGSWPSYNIPYFPDVRRAGGWEAMQQAHRDKADEFSYSEAPRARMFKRARDWGNVTDLDSFMKLMRSNHRHDPLNKGDHCNAISARCDLNPQDSHVYDCFGAHDAKVMQYTGLRDISFMAVLSPTYDNEPPFAWSAQNHSLDSCSPLTHVGHPDIFNFEWYKFPDKWRVHNAGVLLADTSSIAALLPSAGSALYCGAFMLCSLCFSFFYYRCSLRRSRSSVEAPEECSYFPI
eukprot:TRINITY_DN40483_c0_g1_i1.p1 TRINITY_DN40483_c0_g1~~TRINITY_DN40483_c0_g1_i1.p1  ORF type:complete len:652 (+),score=77.19 TRINITY_DN40483_c0_g1_i1:70-2025(+)